MRGGSAVGKDTACEAMWCPLPGGVLVGPRGHLPGVETQNLSLMTQRGRNLEETHPPGALDPSEQ